MSLAKVAELITMPFGLWTQVDPRNHVIDDGPDPNAWMDNFEGENGPIWDMPGYFRQSIYLGRDRASMAQMLIGVH